MNSSGEARCVHRWVVSSQYDRSRGGWSGECRLCGAEKLFPLRDFAENESSSYWRRGQTKAERAL